MEKLLSMLSQWRDGNERININEPNFSWLSRVEMMLPYSFYFSRVQQYDSTQIAEPSLEGKTWEMRFLRYQIVIH